MTRATAHSDPALATESPLRADEIGSILALVREVGWNQVVADCQIFLDLGTVYAVRTSAGRVVATAATLPYDRFAWISMVLVTNEFRRRGLASRLMRRCIDDLTASGHVPVLDATPAGREVYRAMDFHDTWGFHRLALRDRLPAPAVAVPTGITIEPITDALWPALCAYDAAAFGSDRGPLLTRLRDRLTRAELAARRGDRIVGVLIGRDGRTSSQLGPLVAEDEAIALALLARAVAAVPGPIYIDFADAHARVRAWLAAVGFVAQRPLTRMVFKRREGFDDPARTFAVAGPELG
jgi:N-acetylglutamate synthase-like GNAT family acetyltransferase